MMADLPPSLMLVGVVRVAELRCLAHISLETRGGGSTTEAASSQELGPGCLAPTGYFFSLTVTLNLTVPLEPPPETEEEEQNIEFKLDEEDSVVLELCVSKWLHLGL